MNEASGGYGGVVETLAAGRWRHPRSGEVVKVPIERIVIDRTLDGREAELVAPLLSGKRLLVVCDQYTRAALGARVLAALRSLGTVDELVWDRPRASVEGVEELRHLTRHAEALVAVGSGTINDSVKYATFLDGKSYCVFPTSAMNAYTAPTASIAEAGLKKSISAHTARGVFYDLEVISGCPPRLISAAFADVLCRTTSQVDWLMADKLFGTGYDDTPYALLAYDEARLIDNAAALPGGAIEPLAVLTRVCALMGIATCVTGSTHFGSMAEHMISHSIDMFSGDGHPGSSHGEQVGVTTLTVSALQNRILGADRPPVLRPTLCSEADLAAHYGESMAATMAAQTAAKAIDGVTAERINRLWEEDWSGFVAPLRAAMLPLQRLRRGLTEAKAPRTAEELGLDVGLYQRIVRDARFTRDRFSILDVAGDAGLLDDFSQSCH